MKLDEYNHLRNIVMDLIEEYHKDDVDKGGHPYIKHLIRVSDKCNSYDAKIAGLLHDIIEDTVCTEDDLLEKGIPQHIIDIVLLVSRKDGESYSQFIDRIILSDNKHAMELNLSDYHMSSNLHRQFCILSHQQLLHLSL